MDKYEKAKELLGREPIDSDEPFEALVGWNEVTEETVEVEPEEAKEEVEVEEVVEEEKPKKKVKKKRD